MLKPSEKEFYRLCRKGNLVPVYSEIPLKGETPLSAYNKLAHNAEYSFLLESIEGEEKIARFSFLAQNPELILEVKGSKVRVVSFKNGEKNEVKTKVVDSPLSLIRKIMKKYKFVNVPGLPRFCGGLVGYLSYDVIRFFEKLPNLTKDDLHLPDALLILAKDLVIFDHINQKIKIVACVDVATGKSKGYYQKQYHKAVQRVKKTMGGLNKSLPEGKNKIGLNLNKPLKWAVKSNISEPRFLAIVKQAKDDIQSGEIIQVVLSQRFETKVKTDPFNIYRSLRALNPSPYMYFLNFGSLKIIGSSPELLVRCENGIVETRPIAGTRPRGKTPQEDARLAKDLLNDQKEKAEHIMLVDLGRNDLGRVCAQGSVHLSEFMKIEKYSHVMHIVSNVRGRLRKDRDDFDVLQAAFPAGTVSGAPKIRAMEIIEKLEKVRRGPYAGCIGYFSFSGNLDSCITIRTILVKNGKAYVQAGAGIVADSKPQREYQETLNKAKAQLMAIELAHQQQ